MNPDRPQRSQRKAEHYEPATSTDEKAKKPSQNVSIAANLSKKGYQDVMTVNSTTQAIV